MLTSEDDFKFQLEKLKVFSCSLNRDVLWVSRGETRAVYACFMWNSIQMITEPGKEVVSSAFWLSFAYWSLPELFNLWLERNIRISVSSDFGCTNFQMTFTSDTSLLILDSPKSLFEVTCKLPKWPALVRVGPDDWFSLLYPGCLAQATPALNWWMVSLPWLRRTKSNSLWC